MSQKAVYVVSNKRLRFEFYGTLEELIEELDEDEVPCKVRCKFTKRKFKLRKNMFGVIKDYPDY